MEFYSNETYTACRFCTLDFDEDIVIHKEHGVCETCHRTTPLPLFNAFRVFVENLRPTTRVHVRLSTSGNTFKFTWCDINGAWVRFHDLDSERMMYIMYHEICEVWED